MSVMMIVIGLEVCELSLQVKCIPEKCLVKKLPTAIMPFLWHRTRVQLLWKTRWYYEFAMHR